MRQWLVRAVVSVLAVVPLALAIAPAAAAHEDPNIPVPAPSVAEPSTVPGYSQAQQAAGKTAGDAATSRTEASGQAVTAVWWVAIGGGVTSTLVLGAVAARLVLRRRCPTRPATEPIVEPTEPVEAELQRLVEAADGSEADRSNDRLLAGNLT